MLKRILVGTVLLIVNIAPVATTMSLDVGHGIQQATAVEPANHFTQLERADGDVNFGDTWRPDLVEEMLEHG